MAQQGSRGLSQRPKQDQGPQRQGQAQQGQGQAQQDQAQTQRPPTRSFHSAAWNFDGLVQGASSGPAQSQNQYGPGAVAQRTGQGLRRGFGDFANSSSQRNSHAMAPPPPGSNFGGGASGIARTGTNIAPGAPVDLPGNINQDGFTGGATEDQHQSLGFSQAFALGVSIPTSKFNTEAFGTLSVRPTYNSTSNTAATGTNMNTSTAAATVLYDPDAIESLDDDLELPGDFDDEFEAIGMDTSKDGHGLDTETAMSQTGPIFGDNHPLVTQGMSERADDIQSVDEVAILKRKMVEMEDLLKEKEEELLLKSGQASIFKEKLEDESRAHTELREKFRSADLKHQSEKGALEEKHRKDLANANMNHQFEVQKYILDGPSGSKTSKLTQLPRHPAPQPPTPQFPKAFAGFASTQSSIKSQPRDDGFSIHNFAVPPKSPRKSRSFGMNSPALEKPRPLQLQIAGEPVRTAKPAFGFSSNIPTHSIEEITRGKLLAGHENGFGLRYLSAIEADEERHCPLPGSVEYQRNRRLEGMTKACIAALESLMLDVSPRSRYVALRRTTDLLQASLIMRKPFHIVNTFQVLTTLYSSFEDLSKEICKGTVPFLENERENPLNVEPSEATLPSALACIHYLFLMRLAKPILPATTAGASVPLGTRKEHRLSMEAEEQLEGDIFLLIRLVARDQIESKTMGRTFISLVRRRIYDDILNLHLEQKHYRTLDRMLGIIDVVTKEAECSRLFVGWSISKEKWMETAGVFSPIETFVDLIDIKVENILDMANGVVPRLKIKALGILDRLLQINCDQTKKIIYKTRLMNKLIYSIRTLVGIAGQLHMERTKTFSWQKKGSGRSAAMHTMATTSVPSSAAGTLVPKTEPFGPGAGTVNLSELFSAPGSSTMPSISALNSPATSAGANTLQSPSPVLPGTSFSSFSDKVLDSTLYKPSTLITKGGNGGYNVGICLGAREVAAFMSPHNKIFDYLELLKREMEFLVNIFRVMTDYPRHLREREPIEYRSLALSISQVAVRDLGLPIQAQELAHDVLVELVLDDDEEDYFLELVKDISRTM